MTRKYALIIGNTEYLDSGLTELAAPGRDAQDFSELLRNQEICGFDDVKVLLNEPEVVISEAIDEFFDQKKPDDLLVLYFSGHGIRDEFGALYLAVKNTNRLRLRSTAIKSDYIRESMDQSRSKRQILILDCCNSGAFAQGTKAAVGTSIGTASAFEGTGYGRVVLTASDSTQFAWEGNQFIGEAPNSLFTHFLIKGLRGEADKNRDGNITVDELYDYAYEQILNITPKQTPGKWSYKEQGEIILRYDIPIEDTGTRTGELRRQLQEQARSFKAQQDDLLQKKVELEARLNVNDISTEKTMIGTSKHKISQPVATPKKKNWSLYLGTSILSIVVCGTCCIGYFALNQMQTFQIGQPINTASVEIQPAETTVTELTLAADQNVTTNSTNTAIAGEEFRASLVSQSQLVYGPEDGSLKHDPNDGLIEDSPSVDLKNFIVEATFINPYSTSDGTWSYGFTFRNDGINRQYRLVIKSDKLWVLINAIGAESNTIQGGELNNLNIEEGDSNTVWFYCHDDRGALYMNGEFVADLDFSARQNSGIILIATGLLGGEVEGYSTDYKEFTVWKIP